MKFIKRIAIFVRHGQTKMLNALQSLTRSSSFHRTNALSPLLWLVATLVVLCGYGTFAAVDPIIKYVPLAFLAVVIVFLLAKYNYLLKNDPDRLHSEDYLAEVKRLDIIARQGERPQLGDPSDGVVPPKILPRGDGQ